MLTARTEEIDRIIVVLAWEGHELFLHEGTDLLESPSTPRATVRFIVADVDPCWHWRRAQRIRSRMLAPIDDREYGLRDFTILDTDVSASPSDRGPDSQYCRSRPHAHNCLRPATHFQLPEDPLDVRLLPRACTAGFELADAHARTPGRFR